jgi:hypothetical protein
MVIEQADQSGTLTKLDVKPLLFKQLDSRLMGLEYLCPGVLHRLSRCISSVQCIAIRRRGTSVGRCCMIRFRDARSRPSRWTKAVTIW